MISSWAFVFSAVHRRPSFFAKLGGEVFAALALRVLLSSVLPTLISSRLLLRSAGPVLGPPGPGSIGAPSSSASDEDGEDG